MPNVRRDPVLLELLKNGLTAIADEMAVTDYCAYRPIFCDKGILGFLNRFDGQ